MTSRIFTALTACAAASICAVIRPAGCAGDEAVPESRPQAAMLPVAMTANAIRLVDHMWAQPCGAEARLALMLDLDRDVEPHDDVPGLTLSDVTKLGGGTNTLADFDGRRESHLVESVIHEELAVRELRDERQTKMHEQRHR